MITAALLLTATGQTVAATAAPTARNSAAGCMPAAIRLPDLGYGGFAGALTANTSVGWVSDSVRAPQPAMWRRGRLTLLHPPGGTQGRALDINARGDILGASNAGEFAWVRTADGGYHVLPNPAPGSVVYARRINVFGQVAGSVDDFAHAVRWPALDAAPTILPQRPTDLGATGRGLNAWGQVVGDVDDAVHTYPARWDPDSTLHVLSGVFGPDTQGTVYANNDAGQAAGENYLLDDAGTVLGDVAVRYSWTGGPTRLGTLPGDNGSTGYGISPLLGFVAGASYTQDPTSYQTLREHAVVWRGRGPLLTLPVPGLSYQQSQSEAHGITDYGTAVGWAGRFGDVLHPFQWNCVFTQGFVPPAWPPPRPGPPGTPTAPTRSGPAQLTSVFGIRNEQ